MAFFKSSVGTLATQLLIILFGFANNALISHVLGASAQGTFAFITLIPVMLASLGNLGIGISNVYFAGSKKLDLQTLFSNSLFMALGWGSVLVAGFIGIRTLFAISFKIEWDIIKIAAFAVPFSLSTLYLSNLVLGLNQIRRFNVIMLAPRAILFFGLVLFLYSLHYEIGYSAWAYLIAEATTGVGVIFYVLFRIIKQRIDFRIKPGAFIQMLKFGLKGSPGNVLAFLNYRLGMFLILYFLDETALAFYSISILLAEKIWLIPNAIGTVLFPKISSGTTSRQFTPTVCRISLLLTICAALALALICQPLILFVFPAEYIASVVPLLWLLPGVVMLGIPKILTADLAGRGKPIYATISMSITVVLNIGLNIILIPKMNISGAALASTLSYAASAILISLFFIRETGTKFSELFIPHKSDFRLYRQFFNSLVLKKNSREKTL
ncbi:polysaccharide biosynthesis C-terminal domain-containing protein [candidate division KSB1 bacterium]|nr:polysaccharide biosynthesis C-terminal domain-containing protein [candidate division KSB1 bacterium]